MSTPQRLVANDQCKDEGSCEDCQGGSIWIPSNSLITLLSSTTGTQVLIQPPIGFSYIGIDKGTGKNVSIADGPSISYTCTCSTPGSSGGCNPIMCVHDDGTVGGGCGNASCAGMCTGAASSVVSGNIVNFLSGGYIDLRQGVDFLMDNTTLPAITAAMFQDPTVQQAIADFIERVYQGKPFPNMTVEKSFAVVPHGYIMTVVNIFGRAGMVPVPIDSLPSEAYGGPVASCSCTGTCTVVPGKGPCYGCDSSGCTAPCTLTLTKTVANVANLLYSAVNYQF